MSDVKPECVMGKLHLQYEVFLRSMAMSIRYLAVSLLRNFYGCCLTMGNHIFCREKLLKEELGKLFNDIYDGTKLQ